MRINVDGASDNDLYNLLRIATNSDDPESNSIIEIVMQELQKRKLVPDITPIETQEAYELFTKLKKKRKKRPPVWRLGWIAAILVVFIIAFPVSAQAFGLDIFGSFARWTQDVFRSLTGEEKPEDDLMWVSDEYSEFAGILNSLGINVKIPRWLPDGYHRYMCEQQSSENPIYVISWFLNGDDFISIKVLETMDKNHSSAGEKSGEAVEEHVKNGIAHYIMTNNGNCKAIWMDGDYEICIQGEITRENIIRIINSIYERVSD